MAKPRHLNIKDLPSLKNFTQLMLRLKFENIVGFIRKKNKNWISIWINYLEDRLNQYVNVKKEKDNGSLPPKICRDINYILDIINEGILALRGPESVRLTYRIEMIAKKVLDANKELRCNREIHHITGDDIYYRKVMDDICMDIPYIKDKMNEIKQSNNCKKIVSHFEEKRNLFINKYQNKLNNKFFQFDTNCTIEKIKNELQTFNCITLDETGAQTLVDTPTAVSVEAGEDGLMEPTLEEAQAAQKLENLLQQGLQEETPNFDTTYAAASLTGVSLFGVLLYKYTNLGSWLNSRNGSNRGMNRFPMHGELNEDLLMNNFEYLQTGIPNQQYHLAYNSIPN
ncbi:PIR protein [Plasmodium vivax]|nr:PIR protein [Plasmodium vivax]